MRSDELARPRRYSRGANPLGSRPSGEPSTSRVPDGWLGVDLRSIWGALQMKVGSPDFVATHEVHPPNRLRCL